MNKDTLKRKHSSLNQSKFISLRLLPLALLILGFLAVAMSIGTSRISEKQLENFGIADALMDIQILTTTSHLWLEESLDGDTNTDIGQILDDINLAIQLAEALVKGGISEHGLYLKPVKNEDLQLGVKRILELLTEFKSGVFKKQQKSLQGYMGPDQDDAFDSTFRRLQYASSELEEIVEQAQIDTQNKSRNLFGGIYFAWVLILGVSTWGLWRHGQRRLAMEESLKNSNVLLNTKTEELRRHQEHLIDLVEERTAELTERNRLLQLEIKKHKKTNEALLESSKRLKKLFIEFNTLSKAISDPIVLLSTDLKVLWTNDIPGPCSQDKLLGKKGQTCFPHSLNRTLSCEGCSALNCFTSGTEETSQSVTPDGRFWEVRAYPVRNEEGKVISVLTISTDITKKVNLQAETIRTAHLASLGELAAGVAHEINNPINGVINYAQMLIDEQKKAQGEYDIQNRILKEGRRIAGIVKSLLSFARRGEEGRKYVNIYDILSDSLDLTAAQLGKDGIILDIDVPKELPRIFAHFQQIQQVFLNLINNARYALNQQIAQKNGNKVLKISSEIVSNNDIRFVKLTFFDKGVGIPATIIHKIFEPFFSTKPKGIGTGLGLSISHGIISNHGGKIIIDSVEGKYTKIDILLPEGVTHA